MANYFVRKNGNDSNAGTSAGAAWLTIDKAANTVAAGDTVYIGAGIYRELVTMDTSGSSGSVISYIGDIKGTNTGDAGKIIVTAHDVDSSTSARTMCLNLNGKEFLAFDNINFFGGTSFPVGNSAYASATAYEGVDFTDCIMSSTGLTRAFNIDFNAGATPSTTGLRLMRCTLIGGINYVYDSNGTAHINLKGLINGCTIITTYGQGAGVDFGRNSDGGSYHVGGVTFTNNTFICASYAMAFVWCANTTHPFNAYNNLILGASTAFATTLTSSGFMTAGDNAFVNCAGFYGANITVGSGLTNNANIMVGGLHDSDLLSAFGYAHFKFLEPMSSSGYTNPAIDTGDNTYAQSLDLYNNPRQMGRPGMILYRFDGSTATDPGGVWITETYAADGNLTTVAWTLADGSDSSNYLGMTGTTAPSSGDTILSVWVRFYAETNVTRTLGYKVRDASDNTLLDTTVSLPNPIAYTSWVEIPSPGGDGWTWAEVQGIKIRMWRVTDGTGNYTNVYETQIGVMVAGPGVDIGAVEANPQGTKNTTTYYEGAASIEIPGAGFVEVAVAVPASSTTISVQTRWDATYSGSKPQLQVLDIPGIADQSDTATGSSGAWEQLSCTFTPSSAGVARVRMVNRDVSAGGQCLFDDLQIA